MEHKRLTLFAGHYGSGKTNIAVNYALLLAKEGKQVVKASIVLVAGTEGTDALKKEIQDYVKSRTAPYKYPRIVEFKDSLPKTTSGKIIRKKL